MSITHVTSLSELDRHLSSKDKLTVIDFHATWCGPCHAIAPTFESLAKRHTNSNFIKCDVDQAKDVAQKYRVTAMPTFIFLKGSNQVDQIRGADKRALEATVVRHASGDGSSSSAFAGSGQTLGGSSSTSASAANIFPPALAGMHPQTKILLGLLGAYVVVWYFSS